MKLFSLFCFSSKVSKIKTRLDNVEHHLRKFQKEYSHIHEWYVKADHEIRKIENKPMSKNTREEIDWIRVSKHLKCKQSIQCFLFRQQEMIFEN